MESISFVSILDKPEILESSTKIGHSDVECSAGLHLICVNSTDIQKMQKKTNGVGAIGGTKMKKA